MKTFHSKRFKAAIIAVFVLLGSTLHFARESRANPVFLPLIIGVQLIGLMGVGAAIEMYDGAPNPSSAVGVKALSVKIVDPADGLGTSGSGPAVRVPTTTSAASAASIPDPNAPAVGSPPHTQYGYGGWFDTRAEACQAYATANTYHGATACSGQAGTMTYTVTSSAGPCAFSYQCVGDVSGTVLVSGTSSYSPPTQTGCSPGYTNNAGVCNLTNPRAALPDNNQDYTRSGTTLAKATGDSDAAVNAVLSTKYVSNDTADVSGMSVSGQPRLVRTTAKSDGGSEVVQITQKTDGAGVTYLDKRTFVIDSTGTVTSASSSAVSGSLVASGAGSTSKYTETGTGAAFTPAAPGSGSGTGTGTGEGSGNCGGAGQPRCSVSVDDSGFTGRATGPAAGAHDTDFNSQKSQLENITEPAVTWADWMPTLMPGSAVACHPIEFRGQVNAGPAAGLDSTTSLDLCPYLEIVRQIMGWLFGVGALIYVWRRFASARGGAA